MYYTVSQPSLGVIGNIGFPSIRNKEELIIAKLQIKPKSKSNQTKNLERHYIWVVVCSFVVGATLVITASSHFKCCPAEQT